MFLIVGLGNPGKEYKKNRHNIGRTIVETFAVEQGLEFKKDKLYKSLVARSDEAFFLLPETYMNKSGEAVSRFAKDKNISSENILIVHDDLDLALGDIKISFGKGVGGHNGLESVKNHIKTVDFLRLRFGISSSKNKRVNNFKNFVLKDFSFFESFKVNKTIEKSCEAISVLINEGKEKVMNKFN